MSIYRKTYRKTNKQKIETKQKVYRATNRERISMRSKAHYAANKDKRIRQCRDASLMRKYGITPTEYNSMVELQHGLCAICKRRPRGSGREANLYVDHDHNTKRVRGLLCKACNCMLGFVLEDAVILTGCINYIEKYNKMAENNTTTEQRNTQCHAS